MAVRNQLANPEMNSSKPINIDLIGLISSFLDDLVVAGDIEHCPFGSVFHAESVPKIKIQKYLERLATWSFCESDTLILALIYVERISKILSLNT